MKYKLLKDLPDVNAGAIFKESDDFEHDCLYYDGNNKLRYYSKIVIKDNPDWFTPYLFTTEDDVEIFTEDFFYCLVVVDYPSNCYKKGDIFKGSKTLHKSQIMYSMKYLMYFSTKEAAEQYLESLKIKEPNYPKCWEELNLINISRRDYNSNCALGENTRDDNRDIFATEKQALSALAFAQLSQLHKITIDEYNRVNNCDWKPDWKNLPGRDFNWVIKFSYEKTEQGELFVTGYKWDFHHLVFPTKDLAELFLNYHKELWEQYYEL